MTSTTTVGAVERSRWRAVAIPSEHGGWGLTAEPILLGLLVAFSWPGLAIGVAAVGAFLVRTPLKLWAGDRRRHRRLERDRLAQRIAAGELAVIAACGLAAVTIAGPGFLVFAALAAPFVAVELWYDVRSRSRRLVPELCGAVAVSATAAAIVVAGDGGWRLAVAVWMVLSGRVLASIPYVRTQIQRLHRGVAPLALAAGLQAAGVAVALAAVPAQGSVVGGSITVAVVAVAQAIGMRRSPVPPAKVIGLRQMGIGLVVVVATAAGVLAA